MLTRYKLTIGTTVHEVPEECLKNWDEISFSFARTDYSGVMRSYSTEFVFVGEIRDLLWAEYLVRDFRASASITVQVFNDNHVYVDEFSAELDFTSMEDENGQLSINALDNSLAAAIKSKKSQKYQFDVDEFSAMNVNVQRVELKSNAVFDFPNEYMLAGNNTNNVDVRLSEDKSAVISTEYIEPKDQSTGFDGSSINRFFAMVNKYGASMRVDISGVVRCYLCPMHYGLGATGTVPVASLEVGYWDEEANNGAGRYQIWNTAFNDELRLFRINGTLKNMWIGYRTGSTPTKYDTLAALKAAAQTHPDGLYNNMFGIVGSYAYGTEDFWNWNVVYEYSNGKWYNKGAAVVYYQDRVVNSSTPFPASLLTTAHYPMLHITNDLYFMGGTMTLSWADPIRHTLMVRGLTPQQLIERVVQAIHPNASVVVSEDNAGLVASTYLVPAEELRKISGAKVYTTFKQFADWMEAVFGFTYKIEGSTITFLPRSQVFIGDVGKEISAKDIKYSVNDDLIVSTVEVGYSKKEYGEIDGRLEKNFTNYYSTGTKATDNKLSLISKYRADSYGIEFIARKSESQTKDDKSDEDIFVLNTTTLNNIRSYAPANNDEYNPAACVLNNTGLIAVMGNGHPVTLTMTSSDGNNELVNVTVANALFTAGELEFSTEDTVLPTELNALVRVTDGSFIYTGYIKEAKARLGKINGIEYKLIVKQVTAL